jgi:hypothetical protein
MQKIYSLSLLLFLSSSVFSSEIDSIIILKQSPFFTDFLKKESPITVLQLSPGRLINQQHPLIKNKGYQIFKTSNTLFVHFDGSGLLYQLQRSTDSILAFKRIDDTEDANYNILAFLFTNKNAIYNLGGYGFWKSSGTLRQYNTKDKEWDAVPLNEEIHIPYTKDLTWFNPSTEKLFIPYQQIINTGLQVEDEETQFDKRAYQLDLKVKKWKKLGKTHPDFFEIISKSNWRVPTEKGFLISYNNKIYDIDYEKNEIKKYENPSFAQTLERMGDNYFKYYHKGTIHSLDIKTGSYDSLKIPLEKFEKADFRVWQKSSTGFAIVIAPVFIILAATAVKKKRAKEARKKILDAERIGAPTGGTIKIKFSETEKQLLNLLLEKSKNNSITNITEINYVLGIKDKNLGLQKKVRSDVIKSINEKFNFLQDDDTELICNIRSKADKRFFEYYIDKDNIELLEIMLKEAT